MGFAVAEILVHCPSTGTPIPTGLRTEWVLLRSLPRIAMPLHCPVCGQMHRWHPEDAWIAPPTRPGHPHRAAAPAPNPP
jgi:hypothetical protein